MNHHAQNAGKPVVTRQNQDAQPLAMDAAATFLLL
jgi:hypothetical protein